MGQALLVTLDGLLQHPSAQFLSRLTLRIGGGTRTLSGTGLRDALLRGSRPPLRELRIQFTRYEPGHAAATLADLTPLYAAYPRLEELTLLCDEVELGAIRLPALRRLSVSVESLDANAVRSLAAAHLPRLESLELVAGGEFLRAGGAEAAYLARWDGAQWHAIPGLDDAVYALAVYQGELIAGGRFRRAGGADVHQIARWNGTAWASLAGGMFVVPPEPRVVALAAHLKRLRAENPEGTVLIDGGDLFQGTMISNLAFGRPPSDAERDALSAFARKHGLPAACRLLLNANEFVFVD